MRMDVVRPPNFGEQSDEQQMHIMADAFPYRWKSGQRDSVESLGNVLYYVRDLALYQKCGCETWEDYCRKFYDVPADAFDELIAGVSILKGRGWQGAISEDDARKAGQAAAAQRLARTLKPIPDHGGARVKGQGDNITLARGTSASYRVAKLKRNHPDIADRLAAGEFRSVSAAERAAGIVSKEPDDIRILERMHRRASPETWEAIMAWMREHQKPYKAPS